MYLKIYQFDCSNFSDTEAVLALASELDTTPIYEQSIQQKQKSLSKAQEISAGMFSDVQAQLASMLDSHWETKSRKKGRAQKNVAANRLFIQNDTTEAQHRNILSYPLMQ